MSCHGDDGRGNPSLEAPPIAGMPDWYLTAQLIKFRTGARGAHPDDHAASRMRPAARQLTTAEAKSVSAYVASLPPALVTPALAGGDASTGAVAFGRCVACHGRRGQGSERLGAPPLAGQADWYLFSQLKKFKAGIRGGDRRDAHGATMRRIAESLTTEQGMLDIVTHVTTLSVNEAP